MGQTARGQLVFARKGLEDLGIKPSFLNILESRVENRTTAGEYVAQIWQSAYRGDTERAVFEVISDVWEKTRYNKPIA